MARSMTTHEIDDATVHYMGSQNLLFRDGAAMTDKVPAQTFSVDSGQSSRLVRARRHFIESYLRLHDFADVHSDEEEENSLVFSVTADGRTYSLRVSEAWLVASTHARVEERLDRLDTDRKMREHGAAYLDVTKTGQEVLSPSRYSRR
jgi:hypothetical protein